MQRFADVLHVRNYLGEETVVYALETTRFETPAALRDREQTHT